MVDREVALNNLMAAWKDTGLTFTLPPPVLARPGSSPAPSASTSVSSAEAGGRTSESDDDGVDEGYANHPHRDPVMDALMGIRRGKKGKKGKGAAAVSLVATGGGVAAAPPAAVGAAPAAPAAAPAAPPPKPRGRRPKAPINAQCQNDVRAIALVEGLTMLGRSDTESKRKVLPSGRPTPIVVGKWDLGVTEDLAAKMRRTQEYAPRAARPPIICESVKQYRSAAR